MLGLSLKLVTDSEFAGPLALLAIVSIAVAALIVRLLVEAARDIAPERRVHFRLDLARIAAALVFAILVGVSVYLVFAQPGPEQGEAPIWAMAAGLIGRGVMAGADLAAVLLGRQRRAGSTAAAG